MQVYLQSTSDNAITCLYQTCMLSRFIQRNINNDNNNNNNNNNNEFK